MPKPIYQGQIDELSRRITDLENRLKDANVQLGHRAIFNRTKSGEVPQSHGKYDEFLAGDGVWRSGSLGGGSSDLIVSGALDMLGKFTYVANGGEGLQFTVPLPVLAPNTDYVVQMTNAGATGTFTHQIPSSLYTTASFEVIVSSSPKAGDRFDFLTLGVVTGSSFVIAAGTVGYGEINTASNVGTGAGVFKEKVGVDFRFKTLLGGTNVDIDEGSNEVTINSAGGIGSSFFGNGEHGDLSFDGSSNVVLSVDGVTYHTVTPTTGVYHLPADIVALNMTVASGAEVRVNGFRIFVKGLLTFEGKITANGAIGETIVDPTGGNGSGGAGAPGGSAGTISSIVGGANAGAQGENGVSNAAASSAAPLGAQAGANDGSVAAGNCQGGAGGDGGASGQTNGSNGGTVTVKASSAGPSAGIIWNAIEGKNADGTAFTGGSGGGGGAGSFEAGQGGGGGGGGGAGVIVCSYFALSGSSGVIEAKGGNGGDARQSSFSGLPVTGAGGGGGGGGVVILVTPSGDFPTTVVTGGSGGIAGPDRVPAGNGTDGGNGLVRLFTV